MKDFKIAFKMFLFLTLITGVFYPGLISTYAQIFTSHESQGSLIKKSNKIIGSELISQKFSNPKYFWNRPSAINHNPQSSGASNQGPTSDILKKQFDERNAALKLAHPESQEAIPQDLLFASGSGLDPHISPEAAYYQAPRVARVRHMDLAILRSMIAQMTEDRQFGIFGEPRVNVLKLNLALDEKNNH